jgi:hypothetical protein
MERTVSLLKKNRWRRCPECRTGVERIGQSYPPTSRQPRARYEY